MKKLLLAIFIILWLAIFATAQSTPISITGTMSTKGFASKVTVDSLKNELKKLRTWKDSLVKVWRVPSTDLLAKKFIDIHTAPTLTSPTTISPSGDCCGGALYTPPGGSTAGGDVTPNGDFNRSPNGGFGARQWDGDATHIWRVVPAAGTIFGTAGGTGHGFTAVDHGNYIYLYGATPLNPGVSKGQFGVFHLANSSGAHGLVQNWVAKSTTAGGFQANSVAAVGSYDTMRYIDCRSFTSGQEGLYLGYTSAGYAKFNYIYVYNFFAYNSQREGFQIKGANSASISNVTIVGAGQSHTGSQSRGFQWDDSNGRLSYSVFDQSYEGAQIFSHGSTFDHLYINWSNDGVAAGIFLGRTDTGAAFDYPSSRLNGDSVIFDNICFKKTGTVAAYAININLRDAPIMIRNCTFDNITAASGDNRAVGYTNTITGSIGNHGNVSGTCPSPTYGGSYNDPDNYLVQGLQQVNSPQADKGYRSKR